MINLCFKKIYTNKKFYILISMMYLEVLKYILHIMFVNSFVNFFVNIYQLWSVQGQLGKNGHLIRALKIMATILK
jgi:hypothetical protein